MTYSDAVATKGWRLLDGRLSAWFDGPSHQAGAQLTVRIADLSEGAQLPDIDIRSSGVRVQLGTPGAQQPTQADAELALAISTEAETRGLVADPAVLQSVGLAIDGVDLNALGSFWQTTFGYEESAGLLRDPLRRDPPLRFQGHDKVPTLRNRSHLDVVRASGAVAAARTAVGQEPFGAYGLTLADAEGNEVDLVPGDPLSESPDTEDWQVLFGAMTFYPTESAEQSFRLASAVAELADDADVPVMIDVRSAGVIIDSGKDQWEDDAEHPRSTPFVELAAGIQTAARGMDLAAASARLRFVQLGVDVVDLATVRAFWVAVLGYLNDPRAHVTDIYDPRRLNPVIFFQDLDPADTDRRQQRGRIHLDLVVPADGVQARVDAALAAGGRVVATPPGRCTVADPEGNEVDIITSR